MPLPLFHLKIQSSFTYNELCIPSQKDSTLHVVPQRTKIISVYSASPLEVRLLLTDEQYYSLPPNFYVYLS